MARSREYSRLPGRSSGMFRHSLWLGSDHLLSVSNRGYSEDYKRFYYRDIRAVLLRRTATYLVLNVVLGAFAGIWLLVQALGWTVWKWSEGGLIAWGIFAAFFVTLFLMHFLRGPTVNATLYTAVHSEPLPAWNRLRPATRALKLLQARVETVQGTLLRNEILAGADILDRRMQGAQPPETFQPAAAPAILEEYSGNFHWSLFALLLFNTLLTVVGCFYRNAALNIVTVLVYLAIGICMIGSLIRQRNSRMGKGLRRLAWASALYIWIASVFGSIVSVYLMFQEGPKQNGYADLMKMVLYTLPADHAPLLILSLVLAAFSLSLGLAGVVLMLRYRRETR